MIASLLYPLLAATLAFAAPSDTPTAESDESPVERYDWLQTVRGAGTTMSAERFATLVIKTAPSLERTSAAAAESAAAALEVRSQMLPRFDVSLRYTRLFQPDNGTLLDGLTPQEAAAVADLVAGVDDPEAQTLLSGLYAQIDDLSDTRFPVFRNQYGLSLDLTYPVSDVFVTILPAYREAKTGVAANRALERAERAEMRLRAYEAYYGHVRARALAAVAETSVLRAEAQLKLVGASQRSGAATKADVLRAQARVAQARIGRESAMAGVQTTQEILRTLAHLEPGVRVAVSEDALAAAPPLTVELPPLQSRAESDRAEIDAARSLIASRKQRSKRHRGEMMPKLAVVAGLDTARPNTRLFPQEDVFQTTADASVVLSWSPNDLVTGRRRRQQSEASVRQAAADELALRDGVRIEVATAYFEYRRAWASTKEAEAAVAAADETYRAQLARWRHGAARLSDLVDADAEVTRAHTDLVDASVSVQLARAQLERAAGGLQADDFG